jgi:hypothetical protein
MANYWKWMETQEWFGSLPRRERACLLSQFSSQLEIIELAQNQNFGSRQAAFIELECTVCKIS